METKVLDLLTEFSCGLQSLTPKYMKNLEVVLPYELYRRVEEELLEKTWYRGVHTHEVPDGTITYIGVNGVKIKISCKEVNDANFQRKLQECFKILSK